MNLNSKFPKHFPPSWIGLAVVSALRMDRVDVWPGDMVFTGDNKTDPSRFLTRASFDTYMTATWVSALTTLLFGVFKCRSFAEVKKYRVPNEEKKQNKTRKQQQ